MILRQLITRFCENPKRLFLIDGIGAMLSALLLGVVLVKLESIVGIPSSTLYLLATFPIFFAVFDFYSYRKESDKLDSLLRAIATMNLLYCLLSIGFAFFHRQTITSLGWTYVMAEIVIIIVLALIELEVAKRRSKI